MVEKELQRKKVLDLVLSEICHIDYPVIVLCLLDLCMQRKVLFTRQQLIHKELIRDVVIVINKNIIDTGKLTHISDLKSTHVNILGAIFMAFVYAYLQKCIQTIVFIQI